MISDTSVSGFSSDFVRPSIASAVAQFTSDNICGDGATCVVYQMRLDGLRVAVKRLKAEQRGNPTYVAAYRKEYTIGRNLKHDSLPVYRELRADEDEVYIVMDYVDGVSLDDFIQTEEGRKYFSSVANARRFFSELVNVVGYLHRSGIIHCDIKPANIMLRHSDRAVMLLDLDKAYSDTLDQTSGGTAYYSAPISTGEKPTVQKDFAAIGRIIDYMEDTVTDFPASKFRRIKKTCLNGKANAYVLTNLLTRKSYGKIWMFLTILLTVITCTIVIIWNPANKDYWIDSYRIPPGLNQDSIMNEIPTIVHPMIEDSVIPTPSSSSNAASEMIIDIDTPMAEFTSKLEAYYKELTSGITRNRLSDILSELITLQSQAYFKILDNAKLRYPDIYGIDVELEVTRRFEKSKPGKLYVKFNKTISDSLRVWDKDSIMR